MPRVTGIDHLVLSVGDFARSKAFATLRFSSGRPRESGDP